MYIADYGLSIICSAVGNKYFFALFVSNGIKSCFCIFGSIYRAKSVNIYRFRIINIIIRLCNRIIKEFISSTGKLKIDLLWESIPNQLKQESKKFVYKKIKQGARSDEFEEALSWLINCALVYKINRITKPVLPIKAYEDTKAFKLFFLDVGLLCALSKLPARTLIDGDKIFNEFNGALAEQFILQQLKTLEDMEVSYWISKSGNAEIDFVIQTDGYVIPVEVKATTNLQAKSLKVYRENFEPEISIRTSLADFEINNGLYNIPLFMAEKFDEILK